jgi:uncharacterized protein (DUF2147 family)
MKTFRFILIIICIFAFSAPHASLAAFSDGGDILGLWEVEEGDGRIEIFRCAEKFCGRIAWQKEPCYAADDRAEWAESPCSTGKTRKRS